MATTKGNEKQNSLSTGYDCSRRLRHKPVVDTAWKIRAAGARAPRNKDKTALLPAKFTATPCRKSAVPVLRLSAECCCGCAAWGNVPSCFDWSGRNSARIVRAWLGLRRLPRLCAFCHSLSVRWTCSSSRCRSPVKQQGWVYRIKSKRRNFPVLSMGSVY
jgi:hypothetical protein